MTLEETKDLLKSIPGENPMVTMFRADGKLCIAIIGEMAGTAIHHVGMLTNDKPLLRQFMDLRNEALDNHELDTDLPDNIIQFPTSDS